MTTTNPMSYGVFPSFNNKTPKEGPRYIPMTFDFTNVDTWDVDLMQIQQQGKISTLQAFYVDNSLNTAELIITMGLGGQVIKVQPGYQGFMTALVNNVPKFSVSSAGGVSAIVFALNFPVVNALWPAAPNATAGEAVTVTNFPSVYPISASSAIPVTVGNFPATQDVSITGPVGQKPETGSIPVVIASDYIQPGISTALSTTTVGNTTPTNIGSASLAHLTMIQISTTGYSASTPNGVSIKDGTGNIVATFTIPPLTTDTSVWYNIGSCYLTLNNGGVPPTATLLSTPSAGGLLINIGQQ